MSQRRGRWVVAWLTRTQMCWPLCWGSFSALGVQACPEEATCCPDNDIQGTPWNGYINSKSFQNLTSMKLLQLVVSSIKHWNVSKHWMSWRIAWLDLIAIGCPFPILSFPWDKPRIDLTLAETSQFSNFPIKTLCFHREFGSPFTGSSCGDGWSHPPVTYHNGRANLLEANVLFPVITQPSAAGFLFWAGCFCGHPLLHFPQIIIQQSMGQVMNLKQWLQNS